MLLLRSNMLGVEQRASAEESADIINSQYNGDVVVPVLRTVTVKGEHGSYISKNFERPHYVPLNKKIFDTISINIRGEAGDLVASELGRVITLHFRHSKTQYFI